jgi:hypothetical protein
MSSVIKRAVMVVGVLLASAVAAQADTLEVKVPFAFIVGSTQMPAGTYRLEQNLSGSSSVLLIRGEHGNTAQAFVLTTPMKGGSPAGNAPALVFVPDETANRLTQVWDSSTAGQEVTVHHSKARQVGQIILVGRRLS